MRPEKVWIVDNLKSVSKDKPVIVLTDYTGVSAIALGKLRARLKEVSGSYLVVKNRLFRFAAKEVLGEESVTKVSGSTGVAYSDDPVSLAKVLKDFSSENEAFKLKMGFLKNRVLDKAQILELSKIPSKPVLIAQLLGILKRPMSDLVYVLKSQISGLAIALEAIKEQKQKAEQNKAS